MNFCRCFTDISRVSALSRWVYLIGLTFRKFHHTKANGRSLEIPLAAHASFLLLSIHAEIRLERNRHTCVWLPPSHWRNEWNMKVSKDVAEQGHLDFSAIVLNEGTLDRGLQTKWRTDRLLLPFFSKPPRQIICLEGLTVTFSKNETLFFKYFLRVTHLFSTWI